MTFDVSEERMNQILFAGISSAINMFIKEVTQADLESINIEDGMLQFSLYNDLIFAVHSSGSRGNQLGGFLNQQIKQAFLDSYLSLIEANPNSLVESSLFSAFEKVVMEIYQTLIKLYESHTNLFNFLPREISLKIIEDLVNEGETLISGFPNDTIRMIRLLDEKYTVENKDQIMFSLGIYLGIEISNFKYKQRIGLSQKEVLNLLNEISITKFNSTYQLYTFTICPVCRGKQSTKPMCHFFAGFIEGCFDNPRLYVIEETCKASGDNVCTFKIHKK